MLCCNNNTLLCPCCCWCMATAEAVIACALQVVQGLVAVQAGVHHLSGMVAGLQGAPTALDSADASLLEAMARIHNSLQAARSVIRQYPAAEARLTTLVESAADYS
jgi:hypothetical protein